MHNTALLPFMGLVFIALVVAAVAVAAGFKKLNEDKRMQQEQAITDKEESSMDSNQTKRDDDKE